MPLDLSPHDLAVVKPAAVKAWVGDSWQDVAIRRGPKGQPAWKVVVETLQSLQASRVQLLGEDGTIQRAFGDPAGPVITAPAPAPAPAQPAQSETDALAQRLAEAQRIALSAHVEAMKPAWEAVTAANKQLAEMAKQMTAMMSAGVEAQKATMELTGKLASMLSDVTDDAVAGRIEAAEAALETATAATEAKSDKVENLLEKALEHFGPALAQKMTH